jgi:hypothetical protein
MDITDELYAHAVLGKDAEEFFKSELGRYVLARSQEIVDEATGELKTTPAHNTEKIRELQFSINIAEGTVRWLNEQIAAGKQALQQLENIEDQDDS